MQRLRRLRKTAALRNMVAERSLTLEDVIFPVFVVPGKGVRKQITALPGVYHFSADQLVEEAKQLCDLGILALLIFGVPSQKDPQGRGAYASDGIVQKAVRALKKAVPELVVITDVCLCEYTGHGHCGVMVDGYLANDISLKLLAKVAVSHAQAGADMVAPAAMLDGQVGAIRSALDRNGYTETAIMAYSVKYASKLYDPFFKSVGSEVAFGDKRTHQMDFRNSDEAMREIALDIEEGADIVMVKPAFFYLDVIQRAKNQFQMPLAVYNVSGEYAMIKAAAQLGKINEAQIVMESMIACKRAGADLIITYFAKDIAHYLSGLKRSARV
jgi:porphobilinogen synthase